MLDHFSDSVGDLVSGVLAWAREERCVLVAKGASDVIEGECVISQQGKVNMSVVRNPGKAFFDARDFKPNETVKDTFDGIVEDGAAEGFIEGLCRFIDEDIESLVEGAGGGVDPAQNVMVDDGVYFDEDAVGVSGPSCGSVVDGVDDFAGEVSDLVGKVRDFLPDSSEKHVLAKACEQPGDAEREYNECRLRGAIGDDPSSKDLSSCAFESFF